MKNWTEIKTTQFDDEGIIHQGFTIESIWINHKEQQVMLSGYSSNYGEINIECDPTEDEFDKVKDGSYYHLMELINSEYVDQLICEAVYT